ncbi:MAG: calcium-binding protein, partial [Thiohalocapsa sp.]
NTSVPGSFQVTDYNGGGTLTYSYTFVGDPGTGSGAWVTSDRALHLHQDANGTLTVIATDGTTTYTQAFDLVTGGDSTTDAIDFSLSTGPTIGDGLGKADVLTGSNNVDYLIGGTGGDTLIGNGGADVLFGGAGNDTFQYNAVSDSTPTAFDTILDFTASGGDADQIDFSPIAGITTVGLLNLTSVPTTIDAHAIIAVQPGDGNTYVYANAGGVGETTSTGPDVMEIKLTGLVALNAADFLHAA